MLLLAFRPFVFETVSRLAVYPGFVAVEVPFPSQQVLSYVTHCQEVGHSRCPDEEIDLAQRTAVGAAIAEDVADDVHTGRTSVGGVKGGD